MAPKLPPQLEALRRKYARILQDEIAEPLREDLEVRRLSLLKDLHSLEESSDPLVVEDKRMMEVGLEKQLNRIDTVDRSLDDFRKDFERLGSGPTTPKEKP